jgi:hypothetical protein
MYEIPGGSRAFKGNTVAKAFLDDWRISGISTFGTGGRGQVTASYSPALEFSERSAERRSMVQHRRDPTGRGWTGRQQLQPVEVRAAGLQ